MWPINGRKGSLSCQYADCCGEFRHLKTTFHTAFQRLVKTSGRDNIVTHLPRLLMCDIRESTSFQCVTSPFSASSMARSSSDFLPARLGGLTMDTPSSAPNTFLRLGRIAGFSIFNH